MPKNVPEAEGARFKTELITDNSVANVYCDPEEILECNDDICALDIYNNCIADVINIGMDKVHVEAIKFVRGGKVIVYTVNNKRYCLCASRYEISGVELCREAMFMANSL